MNPRFAQMVETAKTANLRVQGAAARMDAAIARGRQAEADALAQEPALANVPTPADLSRRRSELDTAQWAMRQADREVGDASQRLKEAQATSKKLTLAVTVARDQDALTSANQLRARKRGAVYVVLLAVALLFVLFISPAIVLLVMALLALLRPSFLRDGLAGIFGMPSAPVDTAQTLARNAEKAGAQQVEAATQAVAAAIKTLGDARRAVEQSQTALAWTEQLSDNGRTARRLHAEATAALTAAREDADRAQRDRDAAVRELARIKREIATSVPPLSAQIDQLASTGYVDGKPPASLDVRIGTAVEPVGTDLVLEFPAFVDLVAAGSLVVVASDPGPAGAILVSAALQAALAAAPTGLELRAIDLAARGHALIGLRALPHLAGSRLAADESSAREILSEIRAIIAERNDTLISEGDSPAMFTPILLVYHGIHGFGSEADHDESATLWDVARIGNRVGVYLAASVEAAAEASAAITPLLPQTGLRPTYLVLPGAFGAGQGRKRLIDAIGVAGQAEQLAQGEAMCLDAQGLQPLRLDPMVDQALLQQAGRVVRDAVQRLEPYRVSLNDWYAQEQAAALDWPPDARLAAIAGSTAAGSPLLVDLTQGHLLITGNQWSGKSTLLRSLCLQLASQIHPRGLKMLLFDLDEGGDLHDLAQLPHAREYAASPEDASRVLRRLKREIERRSMPVAGSPERYAIVVEGLSQLQGVADLLEPFAYRGAERGFFILATLRPGTRPPNSLSYFPWRIVLDAAEATAFLPSLDIQTGMTLKRGDTLLRDPRRRVLIAKTEALRNDQVQNLIQLNIRRGEAASPAIRTQVPSSPYPPTTAPLLPLVPAKLFAESSDRLEVPVGLGAGSVTASLDAAEPGEIVVIGGSPVERAGCLRSLLLGLAARHKPEDLAVYLLDASQDEMRTVEALPHVVAHSREPGQDLLRCLQMANEEIDHRKLVVANAPGSIASNAAQAGKIPRAIVAVHDLESATQGDAASKISASIARVLRLGPGAGVGVILSLGDRRSLSRDFRIQEMDQVEFVPRAEDDDAWTPGLAEISRVTRDLSPASDVAPVRVALAGVDECLELVKTIAKEASDKKLAAADVVRYVELPELVTFEQLFTTPDGVFACRWERPVDALRVPLGVTKRARPLVLTFSERSVDQTSTVHTFIAGTAGAGKTATLHALMLGLAFSYSPGDLRFIVLDMKGGGDFRTFTEVPHLLHLSTDPPDAYAILQRVEAEYERRVARFRDLAGPGRPMENISDYREAGYNDFPSLLLIIDEPADLRIEREIGTAAFRIIEGICRRGRAVGIHLVLTALEPDPSVLTAVIKATVRGRIVLQMANAAQSAMLLGTDDAVDLRGRGHGIYQVQEDVRTRDYFQGAYADMRFWGRFKGPIDGAMAAAGSVPDFQLPVLGEGQPATGEPGAPSAATTTGADHLAAASASVDKVKEMLKDVDVNRIPST